MKSYIRKKSNESLIYNSIPYEKLLHLRFKLYNLNGSTISIFRLRNKHKEQVFAPGFRYQPSLWSYYISMSIEYSRMLFLIV
jgi:hypothetical protein